MTSSLLTYMALKTWKASDQDRCCSLGPFLLALPVTRIFRVLSHGLTWNPGCDPALCRKNEEGFTRKAQIFSETRSLSEQQSGVLLLSTLSMNKQDYEGHSGLPPK